MDVRDAAEKQAVLGHGVVNAGASEDQAIGTAESGEQDGESHQRASSVAEHLLHHSRAHAIFSGVLDAAVENRGASGTAVQRQDAEVNKIRGDVEQDDDAGAEGK